MGRTSLVGYTGFVGSSLLSQTHFDDLYNSSNIENIQGKEYELVVCAAAPAVKWRANQAPEEDLENIKKLMAALKEVKTKQFVLISTVDVYKNPILVDEHTVIDPEDIEPYGKHRYYLEEFIKGKFNKHLIVRLPGLFGAGLKKNFIYDLIRNNGALHLTHHKSKFQFYNMNTLWNDINIALQNKLKIINLSSDPVSAEEIAQYSLNLNFLNETEKNPVYYDMRSIYATLYNPEATDGYIKSKQVVLQEIRTFIQAEKEKKL